MQAKKILITGGAGFIISSLVNGFQSRGHGGLAVDLYNSEWDNYCPCRCEKLPADRKGFLRRKGLIMFTTSLLNMAAVSRNNPVSPG